MKNTRFRNKCMDLFFHWVEWVLFRPITSKLVWLLVMSGIPMMSSPIWIDAANAFARNYLGFDVFGSSTTEGIILVSFAVCLQLVNMVLYFLLKRQEGMKSEIQRVRDGEFLLDLFSSLHTEKVLEYFETSSEGFFHQEFLFWWETFIRKVPAAEYRLSDASMVEKLTLFCDNIKKSMDLPYWSASSNGIHYLDKQHIRWQKEQYAAVKAHNRQLVLEAQASFVSVMEHLRDFFPEVSIQDTNKAAMAEYVNFCKQYKIDRPKVGRIWLPGD